MLAGTPTEMDEDVARIMVRALGYTPQVDLRTAIVWATQPAGEKPMTRQVIQMSVPEKFRAIGQEPVTAVRLGGPLAPAWPD